MREGSPFMASFQPPPPPQQQQQPNSAFSDSARQRFHVELREPNVVSWRKLVKAAPPPPAVEAPPGANPALEARLAPEMLLSMEQRGGAGAPNRFSNVIEKIERLYQGQGQESDDEGAEDHLDNVPDDDQYNTDDSFIDDKELDEYFCVDRAKTIHSGFFINKGKLENINDPSPPPVAMPKKRKRKEPVNNSEDMSKRTKPEYSCKENIESPALGEPFLKVGECLVNKQAETVSQQGLQSKDSCRLAKASDYRKVSSKAAARLKGEQSMNRVHCNGAKNMTCSPSKAKQFTDCKLSLTLPTGVNENPQKRAAAPKGTLLERAIQDLQSGVTILCPPIPDVQEVEQGTSAPGKTRRLPREVKQKIAKVARLAAKQGKIPDELINRLMGILGHLMQLKTLKRNLKEMVEMGLVAKQEKEGRFSHMKREFTEMVRSRVSFIQAKADEGLVDDFQGVPGSSEKRYKWDQATEDRVCDLYDQYLEGTDENKGVQSRKLYIELAELWPEGWMDKDGIKNAVYRAKERRKALHKQSLNETRKKMSERIDLNDRLPEAPLAMTASVNLTFSSRDLPSSALQTGKPAVIRKQIQRGILDKLNESKDKDKKRLSGESDSGELAFLKFRKQKGDDDGGGYVPRFISRPNESVAVDGTS